jgi:hypothetical protein
MSQSAKLFYQAGSESETLHRRITPTADQFTTQKDRWNDLAEFLVKRLTEGSGYSIRTWLQGSYKCRTQIRPWMVGAEFDIDLGIYFEWKGEPEDGDHTPKELKAFVQNALIDYQYDEDNEATGVADPKERCCRIAFAPDFHIDVPCYHLDSERDARTLATETKGWEVSDPKQIYEWFKDCQEDVPRKKLRRLIRYLKMWAALRIDEAERPSSILLTVLAAEAFDSIDLDVVLDDDDILEETATLIANRLDDDPTVPNPVNPDEELNRLKIGAVVKLRPLISSFRCRKILRKARRRWRRAKRSPFTHTLPTSSSPRRRETIATSSRSRASTRSGRCPRTATSTSRSQDRTCYPLDAR